MTGLRVRFSPDIFRIEHRGGVSRYVTEVHRWLRQAGVDSRILAGLHRNGYLADVDGVLGLSIDRVRPERVRQGVSKIVDRTLERLWVAGQDHRTIYHKTYFDRHVPAGPTLAVTVYDMIHERFPDTAGARDHTVEAKRATCEAAALVLAISECTRVDLLDRFALDPDRVVVTPLGVRVVAPDPTTDPADGRSYLLYVGSRRHRYKNFASFVGALARSEARAEVSLVCFGGGPFDEAERLLLADAGLDDARVASGDDAVLAAHYARARALVYPSLYEGFGLPPLEAMGQGCPVAAAGVAAIPEVVGEAAELFDPTDPDAMAAAIDRVVFDEARRAELSAAGRRRVEAFTWDRTGEATLAAYEQVQAR